MPAVNVYGVRLGDKYKDPEGNTFVVEKFVVPTNPSQEWKAILQYADTEGAIEASVKDIKQWEKVIEDGDSSLPSE